MPQLAGQIGVPLPEHVACYVMAITTGKKAGDIRDRLIGDGLAPLDSLPGRDDDLALKLVFASLTVMDRLRYEPAGFAASAGRESPNDATGCNRSR